MRIVYPLIGVIFLLLSCRTNDGDELIVAPVKSLSDLPTDYRPIQTGGVVTGRLKSEVHAGQLSSEWRYNKQGNLLEGRRFRSGELLVADQYYYDVEGRLRFIQHFESACMLVSTSQCSAPVKWTSYDEVDVDNANRIQESRTFLNQSGKWELRSITNYVYDSQGRAIKLIRHDGSRKLSTTQEFTYDNQSNVTALREINHYVTSSPDLADRTFTYNYDKGLNPYVGTVHYVSPYFISRNIQSTPGTTYEYNIRGYPTKIHQSNVVTELAYY
ncbi:hypothetical protein GCM10028807_49770 [Spirosoma daeguense]